MGTDDWSVPLDLCPMGLDYTAAPGEGVRGGVWAQGSADSLRRPSLARSGEGSGEARCCSRATANRGLLSLPRAHSHLCTCVDVHTHTHLRDHVRI